MLHFFPGFTDNDFVTAGAKTNCDDGTWNTENPKRKQSSTARPHVMVLDLRVPLTAGIIAKAMTPNENI